MSASATQTKTQSAWYIQKVVTQARETISDLVNNHGVVFERDKDILKALDEERVDASRVLRGLGGSYVEAKAAAATAKVRLDDLTIRRNRFKNQQERLKALIRLVMEETGQTFFPDAEFSLSRTKGTRKVHIPDVDDLDDDLVEVEIVKTRKPKTDEIRARLEAGKKVKGATLGDYESGITVRTK